MEEQNETGLVFNIQRFSLHDGAGIRTSVFFQGCNLRCGWCANPESQAVCPASGAREYTVTELADELLKDKPFFDKSGGGVTLTGGEPLLQAEFALKLCGALHSRGVRVALETAANVPSEVFQELLPKLELIHIDLKHYDGAAHRNGTGVSPAQILKNIRLSLASGVPTVVRIPVIPGYNDSPEDARGFAKLLNDLGAREVQLLPFHQMGERKYESMGIAYQYAGIKQSHEEDLVPFADVLRGAGLNVQLGG
jgi:pyruvate formate lyase activating enzyme